MLWLLIYRAWFRGENVHKDHVIIAETILVDGLAVDWIHNNLYWTDTKDKTLEVSTLDGLDRRTLFDSNDGLSSPRAIVLHPSEGYDNTTISKNQKHCHFCTFLICVILFTM